MTSSTERRTRAQAMNDLAGVHARHGSLGQAIICYEHGLRSVRELGDRAGEARTLASLAAVYLRAGRREDAIDCYASSLAILQHEGDGVDETLALRDLRIAINEFAAAQSTVPARSKARTAS